MNASTLPRPPQVGQVTLPLPPQVEQVVVVVVPTSTPEKYTGCSRLSQALAEAKVLRDAVDGRRRQDMYYPRPYQQGMEGPDASSGGDLYSRRTDPFLSPSCGRVEYISIPNVYFAVAS